MECKNNYCKGTTFSPVIQDNRVIGLICINCRAGYPLQDIEIKESYKRVGWNSVKWTTTQN